MKFLFLLIGFFSLSVSWSQDLWPDGSPVSSWFLASDSVDVSSLGQQYVLTDYNICPDNNIQTEHIQSLIDSVSSCGGGVIVVPSGTFRTGALFFKSNTHLHLHPGAVLLGSDNIADYPVLLTRIEGETCLYFSALVNADHIDNFTISGSGVIDGNGLSFYRQFWLRRKWNPSCTNKDEQRPRLLYVSNSDNVHISGVTFRNSPFWTTHFHRCNNLRINFCRFLSPASPEDAKGPSTDAIDLDVVHNVLISHCYMAVNDDAVALKGGKGPYADAFQTDYPDVPIPLSAQGNGANSNILIQDCEYGFCHGCLTVGSECVSVSNVILRRILVSDKANNLLWLKMRPDTPQNYQHILVEDVSGPVINFLLVAPWRQFFDLGGRPDIPRSFSSHVTMRNCNIRCDAFLNVEKCDEQFELSDFRFENLDIQASKCISYQGLFNGVVYRNVRLR